MQKFSINFVALIFIFLFIQSCTSNDELPTTEYRYVGRSSCLECHEKEYNDWKGSDHDKAMDVANDATVLGNFNNAQILDIQHELNRRPRKKLNLNLPKNIFYNLTK